MSDKKYEDESNIIIHKDRIREEIILQFLIKQMSLESVKLKDLKYIAHRLKVVTMNFDYYLKNSKNNLISDSDANSEMFVIDLFEDKYGVNTQ